METRHNGEKSGVVVYADVHWSEFVSTFEQMLDLGYHVILLIREDVYVPDEDVDRAAGVFHYKKDESDLRQAEEEAAKLMRQLLGIQNA